MNDTKEQIFTLDEFQKSEKHKIREPFSIKLESSNLTIVALKEFQLPYDRLSKVRWEKPETIILSFGPSLFMSNGVQVYLGHKDRFEFGEFQINFFVEREKLKKRLDNGGKFGDLIKIAEPGESEYDRIQTLNKRKEYPGEEKEYLFKLLKKNIKNPNPGKVTAERLCFYSARLLFYFDTRLYNTPDFFLAYRNNDLVKAMKDGNDALQKYFKESSYFGLDSKSVAALRSIFFESSLEGREYYALCNNKGVSRDDVFTGKHIEQNLKDESVLGKIETLHEIFYDAHDNGISNNADLEQIEKFVRHYSNLKQVTIDRSLDSFRIGEILDCYRSIWGDIKLSEFSTLLLIFLPVCNILRTSPVGTVGTVGIESENINIKCFFLNLCCLQFFLYGWLWHYREAKSMSERYRHFLVLHTILRFALMNYNAFVSIKTVVREMLKHFEDLEGDTLREHLTAYAAGHSACELEKYWNDISCSGEFKYFKYSGMTLLPPKSHQSLANNILIQKANEELAVAEAKLNGQRETFTSMNHSIKNLVSSVTNALYAAKNENDTMKTQRMIKRASQGASLIAAIANAISYSYRQSNGDWKKDLHATTGSVTMMNIVFTALFHSVPNVFAGEDFAKYSTVTGQYFVSNDELLKAENAWLESATEDAKLKWIQDYLFKVSFDFDDTAKSLLIGDEHSTLIHFFILFNEIFWNTIKAVAYVEKERRQCHVRITCPDGFLVVDLENAANADNTAGNTGFGHIIIENYVKMFEIKDFKEYFDSNAKTYKLHFSLPIS